MGTGRIQQIEALLGHRLNDRVTPAITGSIEPEAGTQQAVQTAQILATLELAEQIEKLARIVDLKP